MAPSLAASMPCSAPQASRHAKDGRWHAVPGRDTRCGGEHRLDAGRERAGCCNLSILRNTNFEGAKLLDAGFFDADLLGAGISGAVLRNTDISLANVTKVNLTNANLGGALVTENTYFNGPNLYGGRQLLLVYLPVLCHDHFYEHIKISFSFVGILNSLIPV